MIIIQQGDLVLTDRILTGDLLIDGDKIVAIDEHLSVPEGAEVINAKGCYVFPGFIDPHTHFQMTNALASTADDFDSGTKAAILGGTTSIINFASPEEGSLCKGLEVHKERAVGHCSCDYKFHMELVEMNEDVAREIPQVVEAGVSSFKVYLAYGFRLTDREIYDAIEAIKPTGALVGAHCENGDLIDALVADKRKRGELDVGNHPLTRPAIIESEAIKRFSTIGAALEYPVHIVHVSSKEGIEEVIRERDLGHKVTCETCPQYLVLDESRYNLPDFEGVKYVMSPPLRTIQDQMALKNALVNGLFQTIGSDHCSFTFNDQKLKSRHDFTRIPGGIPGAEERGIVAYDVLVNQCNMSAVDFMKLVSENPAKLYGMYPKKGTLSIGSDGDITIVDKRIAHVLSKESAHTKADYIPYEGISVTGKVRDVILRGHHVVQDGSLLESYLGECIP